MNETAATICVIGGGITGLVAARTAALSSSACGVVLLEADGRVGGKIRTDAVDGVTVEAGPDSFLARDPIATYLCNEVGLADDLVPPAVFGAYVWRKGTLRRVPAGWPYGIPLAPFTGVAAGVLSVRGALRASAEALWPRRLAGPDVSIGRFVARRFGREVLHGLVDPLLAGTRAGVADRISLAAATPQVDGLARTRRSVLLALRAARRAGEIETGPPPFLGIAGGMERLVDHVVKDLRGRVDIRTDARVQAITPTRRGYIVFTDTDALLADGVVIAVPAFVAADLVERLDSRAAVDLRAIEYASVASVTLVYPTDAPGAPPQGSGVLVPSGERLTVSAATWSTTKWPHLRPRDGRVVVRCFVGRAGLHPALELDDAALSARVAADVGDIMQVDRRPLAHAVVRWPRALPQYEVGHLERIRRIEAALEDCPGVALAGAAYRGSGLPDCIHQGQDAARRVLEAVGARAAR